MATIVHNVMLAINQPLAETGMVTLLSESSAYNIVANVHARDNLFESIEREKPHLLIVDYSNPDFFSLEDLQTVLHNRDGLNVLIISSDDNKNSILRSVQMGIKGYITKECGKNEFLLAVESTARGEKFFCSKILDVILENRLFYDSDHDHTSLTIREKEVLKFLAQGNSTQKIAETLHLSPHTVQTHRKSIIRKLKIKSPTQFVIYALDMGLIVQK